jgi:hypothetical protein
VYILQEEHVGAALQKGDKGITTHIVQMQTMLRDARDQACGSTRTALYSVTAPASGVSCYVKKALEQLSFNAGAVFLPRRASMQSAAGAHLVCWLIAHTKC